MTGKRNHDTSERYLSNFRHYMKKQHKITLAEYMPSLKTTVKALKTNTLKVSKEHATFEPIEILEWYENMDSLLRDRINRQEKIQTNLKLLQYLNVFVLMYIFALRPIEGASLTDKQFDIRNDEIEIYIPRAKTRYRQGLIQSVTAQTKYNTGIEADKILEALCELQEPGRKYFLPKGKKKPWPDSHTMQEKLRKLWTIYNNEILKPRGTDIEKKIKFITNYSMRMSLTGELLTLNCSLPDIKALTRNTFQTIEKYYESATTYRRKANWSKKVYEKLEGLVKKFDPTYIKNTVIKDRKYESNE